MKTTLIASAFFVLSIATTGSAFAQHGYQGDRDMSERYQQKSDRNVQERYQQNNGRYGNVQIMGLRDNSYGYRNDYDQQHRRDNARAANRYQDLHRGQRRGHEFSDNRYAYDEGRHRRVSMSPRGHH